jgi:glycosyltransferase involved in cell wall biosynthesis
MYLIEACGLKRLAGQQNIPWVHAHFGTNSAAVAMFCRLLGGPSYSFTVHGPEEFDRPELLHLREKIKHADMVIAISHFCRSQLYRWCDWEEWGKIKIIRCGISETFAAQDPRPITDNRRLVCVARLAEQKGLPVLMDAAASLVRAGVDFRLDIMGDGVLRKPLEEMIVREGLQGHVFLRGWQTEVQIREAIESSRALVLPSFAEGLPVVLMEALALGRPVVCTRIAGISELVVDGENGWLVNASDAQSLEAAMRKVLEAEPDKLSAMGQCGAERVFARHLAKDEALRLGALFLDHQAGSSFSLTEMGSDPLGRGQ